MGRTWIEGTLLEGTDQDTALKLHLQNNHYPPIPLSMVPVCKKALENAKRGDWESLIELPEPITFRGEKSAPTYEIIDAHHLDVFLEER